MKYRTKQRRLRAVLDAYCETMQKSEATIDEISIWAKEAGLHPVPSHLDSDRVCKEWERRLDAAKGPAIARKGPVAK